MKRRQRTFTAEIKADAVSRVQQQGYTDAQACQALGIGETALRRWVTQVEMETAELTPRGRAITPKQQRIQALEAQVKRLEMEKVIFKKAETLLAEDVSLAMRKSSGSVGAIPCPCCVPSLKSSEVATMGSRNDPSRSLRPTPAASASRASMQPRGCRVPTIAKTLGVSR